MVINRAAIVVFYACISFSIDSGVETKTLLWAFIAGLSAFILSSTILSWVFARRDLNIPSAPWPNKKEAWLTFGNVLACSCHLLGLAIPFILGTIFFDYRLTLANFSFIFNTTYVLITVFLIENKLAKLIDQNSDRLAGYTFMIMAARIPSAFIVLIGLLYWALSL